ncbi:MAG TPA: hypothetical protein VMU69_32390 [Bradyrhizobium sp.]|nr:hypothetical protein [Bradyrhizobium sp.]
MEFASANPSVIRSIKQRILLNAWLRMPRSLDGLPAVVDFQPEDIADELADMMGFTVEGAGDGARFLITQEGATVALTYGNNDPARRTNRYLDDAISPDRYPRIALYYRTLLARKRPIYSITTVRDADGKEVSFERLLLPFGGTDDRVEQIVGSYKTISVEGRFKLDNLLGPKLETTPVPVVRAVIDSDLVQSPAKGLTSDDVAELDYSVFDRSEDRFA